MLAGCGTDCGTGTVEKDGACVAVANCGPGTSLNPMTGQCVPGGVDGTCQEGEIYSPMLEQCIPDVNEICTGNTTWDENTNTCVVDEGACEGGTVLSMGKCVPFDETLVADHNELPEPNDPRAFSTEADLKTFIGQLREAAANVPEVGQTTTLKGCIDPESAMGPGAGNAPAINDADYYMLNASAPSVIRVRITALGGIAAGFSMAPVDEGVADGWFRLGMNLRGDDHERELFLPEAGSYVFAVDDARNLITNSPLPVGGSDACYFVEIERQALPEATAAELGADYTGPSDKVQVFSLTANEAQFLTGTVVPNDEEATARPAMALDTLINNSHRTSAIEDSGTTFSLVPSLKAGDAITMVVDHAYNLSRGFDTFKFTPSEIATEAFPENGTGTITQAEDGFPTAFYFEGTGGQLANLIASIGDPNDPERPAADFLVVDPFGRQAGWLCSTYCSEADGWVNTHANGYYYLLPFLEAPGSLEVNLARSSTTPAAFNVGESKSIDLNANKRVFFTTDFAGSIWLRFLAESRTDITMINADYFDLDGSMERSRVLGDSWRAAILQRYNDDKLEIGRVTIDDERKFLISFYSGDESGGGTFDFSITNREFENMGTLSAASPFASKEYTVDENDTLYFLGRSEPAATLTVTATPTAGDVAIHELDILEGSEGETNEGGAGEAEVLETILERDLVVYRVDVTGETGGKVSFKVDVVDPPYSQAAGSKPFNDICASGTEVSFTDGLSAPIDISAAGFEFFGQAEGQVIVSNQGWLTFDPAYADDATLFGPFPTAGTSIVAPYATYMDSQIEVCYAVSGTGVTFQWSGFESFTGGSTQVQAVLNSDGTIDFIYGPNLLPGLFGGDIGLENHDGTVGLNRLEPVEAGVSVTWTPAGL